MKFLFPLKDKNTYTQLVLKIVFGTPKRDMIALQINELVSK